MPDQNWSIRPRVGLGQLAFGMSPREVAQFDSIYGSPESANRREMPQSVVDETLALFGDSVSEQDRRTFLEAMAQSYPGNHVEIRTSEGPVLVLEYEADQLVEIQVGSGAEKVGISEFMPFDRPSKDVLEFFEVLNDGAGRFRSSLAAFDSLAVELSGFCMLVSNQRLAFLSDEDEPFADRTITIRKTPYLPPEGAESFVTIPIVKQ